MADIAETLRADFQSLEFAEDYGESFLDTSIATQIKVLREQRDMTQTELGKATGTTQTAICRLENINYSGWSIKTLKKLARAFRVRLKVTFETYGSLVRDVDGFERENLMREPHEEDREIFKKENPRAALPIETKTVPIRPLQTPVATTRAQKLVDLQTGRKPLRLLPDRDTAQPYAVGTGT